MNDLNNPNNESEQKENFEEIEEEQLGFSDKMVGIFTEPGNIFENISKFELKASNWVIPVILVIVFSIASQFFVMSNPQIKYDIIEKQMKKVEKNFEDAVAEGNMTQEQADQYLSSTRERMENMTGSGTQVVINAVSITVVTFIMFFIVSGFFFLLAKFALKGEGSYSIALSAYGLPYYILILQAIVVTILSLLMNKLVTGVSIATFMDVEKTEIMGYILSKIDIFSIWFYTLVSIGFAKLFKASNSTKYFIMVFGSWIGFSIIFFLLAKAIPFLSFLIM